MKLERGLPQLATGAAVGDDVGVLDERGECAPRQVPQVLVAGPPFRVRLADDKLGMACSMTTLPRGAIRGAGGWWPPSAR